MHRYGSSHAETRSYQVTWRCLVFRLALRRAFFFVPFAAFFRRPFFLAVFFADFFFAARFFLATATPP